MNESLVTVVEDEPGHGKFHLVIIEDERRVEQDVLALNISDTDPKALQTYIEQQLQTSPLFAFRIGPAGDCQVQASPSLLKKGSATRLIDSQMEESITAPPHRVNYSGPHFFLHNFLKPTTFNQLLINATTIHDSPFKAAVTFVPSPST